MNGAFKSERRENLFHGNSRENFFKECFLFRLKRKVLNFRFRDESENFLYELRMMQFRSLKTSAIQFISYQKRMKSLTSKERVGKLPALSLRCQGKWNMRKIVKNDSDK